MGSFSSYMGRDRNKNSTVDIDFEVLGIEDEKPSSGGSFSSYMNASRTSNKRKMDFLPTLKPKSTVDKSSLFADTRIVNGEEVTNFFRHPLKAIKESWTDTRKDFKAGKLQMTPEEIQERMVRTGLAPSRPGEKTGFSNVVQRGIHQTMMLDPKEWENIPMPTTGNKALDITGNLTGTALGFVAGPANIGPAGGLLKAGHLGGGPLASKVGLKAASALNRMAPALSKKVSLLPKVGSKLAPKVTGEALEKLTQTVVQDAVMGGTYGVGRGLANNKPLPDVAKEGLKEAAIWTGLGLGGRAAFASGKALKNKLLPGESRLDPREALTEVNKAYERGKAISPVAERARTPLELDGGIRYSPIRPDFTADAFGNVNRGTGPAGLLPPGNVAKPRRFSMPNAQTELRQAVDEYNSAVEAIQNYLGHNDVLATVPPGTTIEEALAQAEKAAGVNLREAIARVEQAEQRAAQTLRGELQSKKTGIGPAVRNYLGPELKKPASVPTKEIGRVDWRLGKPEIKTGQPLKPQPLQFKKTIEVPRQPESFESPQKEWSHLNEITSKHRSEVASGLKESTTPVLGQGIKVIGGKDFLGEYKPAVSEVEAAVKAGQKPFLSMWENIGQRISKLVADSQIEPTIKDYPRVREHIRYAKEIPSMSRMEATETLEGILGDVNRADMDLFTRKVVYEDWLESLSRGEKIPFDLTAEQVSKELNNVGKYLTPKLKRAYERHLEVVNAMAEDLVTRGKMSEKAIRENYFPHKVLFEYGQLLDERIPGLPEKLKTPFRGYVQRRKGSSKPIATDYIDSMHNLLTKVKIDNAIDDSIENLAKIGEDYTKKAGVPGEVIERIRRTGVPETYKGKSYKVWQPDTGNYFYPSLTITESGVQKALAEQLPLEVQTIIGQATKEGLVVGKKKPTFVLPAEVADRLNNFRKNNIETEISKVLQDYTRWWKKVAVLMPGLKHDWFNLIGDLDRFTTGLGTKEMPGMVVKAIKMIKDKDPGLKELLKQGVFSSEVYMYSTGKFSSPKLRELAGPAGKMAYYNPVSLYQRWRVYREAVPRIAAHLLNQERQQAGKTLKNRFAVDVEGLLPEEAIAKIGRETMVDYNMLSKNTEAAKKFWFPFITWYTQNFKSYASMIAKKPLYGLARVFMPMAALTVWNRVMFPEVEKNLPDYWRENPHLVTGIQTKDGGHVIIPIPFAGAIAASMVGLHTLPDTVARYMTGEMSLGEALKKQGKDVAMGPVGAAYDLATPFARGPFEIARNKDWRGYTIVSNELKGTPEALKLQVGHMFKSLVPPVSKGMQWMDEREYGTTNKPLPLRPFGGRVVDPEQLKQRALENKIYEYTSEEVRNTARYDFTEAYKRYKANPTPENIEKLKITAARLSETQIKNIINDLENPKTKEQRLEDAFTRVPKALRPELEKELLKIQNR